MARGALFDPALEERIGDVIGLELRASGATFTGAACMTCGQNETLLTSCGEHRAGDGSSQSGGRFGAMEKPDVSIPDETAPRELVVDDLTIGDGDEAASGQQVSVHYVGVSWSTGEQFDASWDRMEPFRFGLGQGQVIAGWDEGVRGMKVGGRRRLTIPPEKGYGAAGAGGVIAANETLVFVVDLLAVG